jgi:hypothetical protein
MIPRSLEGLFFSFFEITDKGSSWIGPLVSGIILEATKSVEYPQGNLRIGKEVASSEGLLDMLGCSTQVCCRALVGGRIRCMCLHLHRGIKYNLVPATNSLPFLCFFPAFLFIVTFFVGPIFVVHWGVDVARAKAEADEFRQSSVYGENTPNRSEEIELGDVIVQDECRQKYTFGPQLGT